MKGLQGTSPEKRPRALGLSGLEKAEGKPHCSLAASGGGEGEGE